MADYCVQTIQSKIGALLRQANTQDFAQLSGIRASSSNPPSNNHISNTPLVLYPHPTSNIANHFPECIHGSFKASSNVIILPHPSGCGSGIIYHFSLHCNSHITTNTSLKSLILTPVSSMLKLPQRKSRSSSTRTRLFLPHFFQLGQHR